MNRKHFIALMLALALALVSALAFADEAPAAKQVTVSTVDEFLAAIAPAAEITLAPGQYDLSKAKDIGKFGSFYTWEEVYDGFELVIANCEGLSIIGSEGTELVTPYAYADVIRFSSCADVLVKGITAGHIVEPGSCCGDVLEFSGGCTARVEGCKLYGCGEVGITLDCMDSIEIVDSDIYSCSFSGIYATASAYVTVDRCRFYDIGKNEYSAGSVFTAYNCYGFAVTNSYVHDNKSTCLASATFTEGFYLGGCTFKDNNVEDSVFAFTDCSPVIENCSFGLPKACNWFYPEWSEGAAALPVDREGRELDEAALASMSFENVEYDGVFTNAMPAAPVGVPMENGQTEYHVSTVDEFLAAIGDDRVIVLDQPLYTLSEATGYGSYSGRNFYWLSNYDGPGLVIRNAVNLTVKSEAGASIIADPRYAEVLMLENCTNVVLENLTLGHSVSAEAYSCSGGVVQLSSCTNVELNNCHLFGCGIMGVTSYSSNGITVKDTEIYDCANGALWIGWSNDFTVSGCSIHDCGSSTIYITEDSYGVKYEGLTLNPGEYSFDS